MKVVDGAKVVKVSGVLLVKDDKDTTYSIENRVVTQMVNEFVFEVGVPTSVSLSNVSLINPEHWMTQGEASNEEVNTRDEKGEDNE